MSIIELKMMLDWAEEQWKYASGGMMPCPHPVDYHAACERYDKVKRAYDAKMKKLIDELE